MKTIKFEFPTVEEAEDAACFLGEEFPDMLFDWTEEDEKVITFRNSMTSGTALVILIEAEFTNIKVTAQK